MKFYKEVAKRALYHNGKPYEKGATVRERVPLSETNLRELKRTPELTNCEYILIEDSKKKVEKPTESDKKTPVKKEKKWADMNGEERKAYKEQKANEKN